MIRARIRDERILLRRNVVSFRTRFQSCPAVVNLRFSWELLAGNHSGDTRVLTPADSHRARIGTKR